MKTENGTRRRTWSHFPDTARLTGLSARVRRVAFQGLVLWMLLSCSLVYPIWGGATDIPRNFFANPGFELGKEFWRLAKTRKTESQFSLDTKDPAYGQNCALIRIDSVEDWGVQFGQAVSAGERGKIYTLAAFAKSEAGPVEVGLQIERSAKPWDRAASGKFKLTTAWQELHVTFRVDQDFSEGWFAYLSCAQPKVEFLADMFRLYEGPYVPYQEIAHQEESTAGVRVFDSGVPSTRALDPEMLAKKPRWTELPEDELKHKFRGDAVVCNARVAVVLRRGAKGAEVYSLGPEAPTLRTVLAPAAGTDSWVLSSCTFAENTPAAAAADVEFRAADGRALSLRYGIKIGQPVVETEARNGATHLQIEAPCRFALMPDFFADDIVVDAAELAVTEADLPSDNFVMHLLPDHQAIIMAVVKTGEEDIRVALSREQGNPMIRSSTIRYGKDGTIWVAVLAGRGIWHLQDVAREQAGEVIPLRWVAPFPARWRTDWRREGGLTESWEMLTQLRDGSFEKNEVFGTPEPVPADRKRWTTVLGTFAYPCWLDKEGQGWFEPIKHSALRFQGPAIIYPLNRAPATPLEAFTVVDVVRNTLGVGPCEYVLDVEGQQSQYKGRATCAVRDALNPIFSRNLQKQRRKEIEGILQDLMIFIRHIRGRIANYVEFGHDTVAYLAEQAAAHPDLAQALGELEQLARLIDTKFAARQSKMKTPDDAAAMVEEFRTTVLDYEGGDALSRCKRFTADWVTIGGNQDELAGECRWVVKLLRQKAGLSMAKDPRMTDIAKEIRRRTQRVLRNPAVHESARH